MLNMLQMPPTQGMEFADMPLPLMLYKILLS